MKIQYMRNIRIGQRILILLQFMSIPTIIIFVLFLFMINRLQDSQSRIFLENISSIRAAYNLELALLDLKGFRANYILDGDRKWLKKFDDNVREFNRWYNEAFESATTETERDILSAMSLDFEKFIELHREIVALAEKKNKKAATEMLLDKSPVIYTAIYEGCERLIHKNEALISETEEGVKHFLKISTILGYLIIVIFVFIGIILAFVITRSIVDPIREMEKSGGDFGSVGESKNEMERLKERYQQMLGIIQDNQQKMVESERKAAIGEIAAGMSHELNNPIGIIYGFAEMLLSSGSLSDHDRDMVNDIFKESGRCKKLLGDLLDFAKSPEPNYRVSDIKKLVKDTVKMLAGQARFRHISFKTRFPAGKINIRMDDVQMRQVFLNLLLNACDAAKEQNGVITASLHREEKTVQVIISDNGDGIKQEDLARIFNPFFSTKAEGSGLGLALSRDIINKHNGRIEASSEYGKGASFIISLPEGLHGAN
jgi:signal transduction histidine kinase